MLPLAAPALAAHSLDNGIQSGVGIIHPDQAQKIPPLDAAKRQRIEQFAQTVAAALILNKGGTVALSQEKVAHFAPQQHQFIERLAADLNSGKIGIAITRSDGTVELYGNPHALDQRTPAAQPASPNQPDSAAQPMNSWWWNWNGIHLYVDSWWTYWLTELSDWAIGAIAGLVVQLTCSTGVGCLIAGPAVSLVWWIVWNILRPYLPESYTIHLPWWGYVYVQPWKSGAWYDGWWFQTWLWT
jgi:hypothetical protein